MTHLSTFTRHIAVVAAAALVAGAAVPAMAADPVTTPKADAKPAQGAPKLNRRALAAVWCVTTPTKDGAEAKKECKSRKAWIKEGRDPFAK